MRATERKGVSVTITLTTPDGSPLAQDEVPAQGTLLVLQIAEMDENWPADGKATLLGWVPTSKAGSTAVTVLKAACKVLNQ